MPRNLFGVVVVCIWIISNSLESSFGTKFQIEGDWVGTTNHRKALEKADFCDEMLTPGDVPSDDLPIRWHFWLDGRTNQFIFVDPSNNDTSSGNFSVDIAPTPNALTFQFKTGPNAGLLSYGIYQYFNTTPATVIMSIARPGLPLRPVNFQPNPYVAIIKGSRKNTPYQIHLAFGDDPSSTMIVSWVTVLPTATSEIRYGTASNYYTFSEMGNWSNYTYKNYTSGAIHKVPLSGLKAGVTYYYRVGDNTQGYSRELTFRVPADNNKVTVTIWGDINLGGVIGGNSTVWADSLDTLDTALRQEQDTSDFLLHVGDVAYCNGHQTCWDQFFQDIQPIASHMPYMACFGNHDVYPEPFGYTNRFFMPGPFNPSFQDGNYFYSFNLGPVHFVGFSTELWFLPQNATVNTTQQMTWLLNDLHVANQPQNRKVRPWILAFGHRPIYCSVENYPDCQNGVALELQRDMEPLFIQNGVDVAVFGHIHSMERSYPVSYDATVCGSYSNPCGTVHVVNGAAGQPFLGPPYPKPSWSAFRNHTHGYARMTATLDELQWDFVSKSTGETIDSFTLLNPFKGMSKNWTPGRNRKKPVLID